MSFWDTVWISRHKKNSNCKFSRSSKKRLEKKRFLSLFAWASHLWNKIKFKNYFWRNRFFIYMKIINKHFTKLTKLILNLSCRRSQGAYHQNASQWVASYEPTSCESITLRTIELRTYHTVTCKLWGSEHISCEFTSSRFALMSQPNCIWIKIQKSRLIFFVWI